MCGESIGQKLIKLRGERTQSEVAQAIGVADSTIGMYESDRRVPRDEIKVKLAEYFGVSIESLFFSR